MEREKAMTDAVQQNLFNGALETGVRSVVILETAYPRTFDLTQLTWLDHLVVHTEDLDGHGVSTLIFRNVMASCWSVAL
jgi:hypothetical protein